MENPRWDLVTALMIACPIYAYLTSFGKGAFIKERRFGGRLLS